MDQKQTQFITRLNAHRGILHKIARIYQDDPQDRGDLLQEMTLQLWKSYDSFSGESAFSTWMYRVALNTAIGFYKKKKRWEDLRAAVPYDNLPDRLETVTDDNARLEIFYEALAELGAVDKALVILHMEGRSGKETGEILGIGAGNVRVKLSRAKEKLKYIIKTKGYEF